MLMRSNDLTLYLLMFLLSKKHTIDLQWKNAWKNTCGAVSFLVNLPVKDL